MALSSSGYAGSGHGEMREVAHVIRSVKAKPTHVKRGKKGGKAGWPQQSTVASMHEVEKNSEIHPITLVMAAASGARDDARRSGAVG